MSLPPGPRQPAFAQLLQYTFRPLAFFEESLARHGDPFTLRLTGLGDFVMVTGPELLKQVFTADTATLTAGSANAILAPLVGPRSVLLLDGPEHLRMRRLLLPPLRGERMAAYAATMAGAADAAVDRFPTGRSFSMHRHMQDITLEVILRAVFGVEDAARMRRLGRLLVEFLEPPPAIYAFLPALQRDLPLSPFRKFLRRRDAVDRELFAMIDERRRAGDAAGRSDVLSLLLEARDEAGRPLGRDELRDELVTMLTAGHETTATALSWAFACLLESPDALARLAAELAPAVHGGAIDLDAVARCEYLDAVVKESLRLRPILPDVVREARVPYALAGHEIPPGAYLTPCIYLAHRDAAAWPEPARFRPERFLGLKIDPYRWFPFGGGIRRCLGMAFALYEMKVVLAVVVARTRLRLARPVHVVRRTITLAPSHGTEVVLCDRRPRVTPRHPQPAHRSSAPVEAHP